MSAQALRNARGAFAAIRNPVDLYWIVREGALLAASYDDDPLKSPAKVTQPAWDAVRHALESKWGPPIPKASEICRRLRDHGGASYPWYELLETVFTDGVSFAQHHAQRRSQPDRTLSDDRVYWAANRVAAFLQVRTLRPSTYDAGREQLLEQPGLSQRSREAMAKALPNANQLTAYCGGSWDRALEIAKLEPRSALSPAREAVPRAKALAFFFLAHGYVPSQNQLELFACREDFALQAPSEAWEETCSQGVELIKAQGLPEPNPYPSKIPPDGWEPVTLDLSGLPARQRRGQSRLQALESAYTFKLDLASGETPTDARYKAFALGKKDISSLNVINRFGGLAVLLREVARPDWREQATLEQDAAEQEARELRAAEKGAAGARQPATRKPRQRDPRSPLKFLLKLRNDGPCANRELRETLGVSRMSVCNIFHGLKERGFVEATEQTSKSPHQRYTLTVAGREALEDVPALRELLASPPCTADSESEAGAPENEAS
jgi:DNA-binding HxlR family transcriptional regulator